MSYRPMRVHTVESSAQRMGLRREVAANDPDVEAWSAEQRAREQWVRAGTAQEIADAIRWQSEQALQLCRDAGVETP